MRSEPTVNDRREDQRPALKNIMVMTLGSVYTALPKSQEIILTALTDRIFSISLPYGKRGRGKKNPTPPRNHEVVWERENY